MEKEERIAMLYKMLEVADQQVQVYSDRVVKLEKECFELQLRVNELEGQIYGGKVQ